METVFPIVLLLDTGDGVGESPFLNTETAGASLYFNASLY